MTDEELSQIEARANAATAAAWMVPCHAGSEYDYRVFAEEMDALASADAYNEDLEDGQAECEPVPLYCAAARADVPALVAAVRESNAKIADLEEEVRRLRAEYDAMQAVASKLRNALNDQLNRKADGSYKP